LDEQEAPPSVGAEVEGNRKLALLLAMAMFVLVVDTSIMNVSITAVASDLNTSVSSIQSAIALEALVSAAFILINSKLGDIMGRKRAYVLGLLGYAVGALAMTVTQSVTTIVIFWAIIGGIGASLLLPAMQSLIHGNFQGAAQKQTYALVGAAAAVGAAIGPLLGGFVTTYLSWRVGFALEVVIIAIVLFNINPGGGSNTSSIYTVASQSAYFTGTLTSAVNTTGTDSRIGAALWSGFAAVSMTVAEVITFNSILDGATRDILMGYAAWKWGLQGNLPSAHPWKGSAPTGRAHDNDNYLRRKSGLYVPRPLAA